LLVYTLAPLLDDRYAVERVSSDRASGRIDIWFTAWHAFLENPLTGIGAGNFVPQSIERLTTEPGVELVKSHLLTGNGIEVHNIYLESLAERGVFGLLTLLLFLGCTLWCLALAARRFRDPVITALAPMLVAYCVAAVFLSVSNSKLLWMLAGLAAALLSIPGRGATPGIVPNPAPRSSS
jgi:O-antigen ligase